MTIYYVSKAGGASDSNPGTQASPWLTIGKAVTVAVAGDTVYVVAGTYPEYGLIISASGTATERIRFISVTKWGALMRPAIDVTEGSAGYPGNHIFYLTGDYIDIIGFDITPAGGEVTLIQNAIGVEGDNCSVRQCKIVNINTVSSWVGSAIPVIGYSNVIDSNVVIHVGNSALDHGIYQWGGINTIINNLVGNVKGFGITTWHACESTFIHNNTVFNCLEGGILVASGESPVTLTDGIITNNICYGNGTYGIQESSGESTGCLYYNNLCYNNTVGTIYLYTGTEYGTVTTNPTFVNYQADGSGDYHVSSGSPAINGGYATYAPAYTADGFVRVGTPDIGAYDYTASVPWTAFSIPTAASMVLTDWLDATAAIAAEDAPHILGMLRSTYLVAAIKIPVVVHGYRARRV